jgi:Transmembrane secretion effector
LIFAVACLRRKKAPANLPLENFLESFITAVRYVRYAPGILVVMARNILFALFISVIPALLPVVGLKELHLDPSNLGLVFTSMGVGSVVAAVSILSWARSRLSSNSATVMANVLVAVVFVPIAIIREVMVPSWTEHLLEQERMTTSEQNIVDKAWALHVGEKPPEMRHFLCVNRQLQTRHHPVTRPSAMPEAPLSVDRVDLD